MNMQPASMSHPNPTPTECYDTCYLFCEGYAAVVSIPEHLSTDQWDALITAFRERAVPDAEEHRFAHVWVMEMNERRSHAGVFWDEELANSQGSSYVLMALADSTDEALSACENHIKKEGDVVRIQTLRPQHFIHEEAARMVARVMLPEIPPVPVVARDKLPRERAFPERGGNRLFVGLFPTGFVYVDRWVDASGDYKKLGYLNYAELDFQWEKGASTAPQELLDEVVCEVENTRARLGESQVVAGNMSVILGSGRRLPTPAVLNRGKAARR